MRNQLFMAVPADAWERIFGEKQERVLCWYCSREVAVCGLCGRGYKSCIACNGRGHIVPATDTQGVAIASIQCKACQGSGRVKE